MTAPTSSINLLSFPEEIINATVQRLPGTAIKAVRESCKKLNRIASPYLFPVLYISCHQLDLDVFRLVASNPLLIGGVRELVIDDTTVSSCFADWRTYHAAASHDHLWLSRKAPYWNHNPRVTQFKEEGRVWSDGPDKELWHLFMSVFRGHHENRLAHTDIDALKQALPSFKSLRSLVVTNRNADDEDYTGAQSLESTSPVVKMWRRFGTQRRERPPFPPRCDWIEGWVQSSDRTPVLTLDWLDDQLQKEIETYGLPYDSPAKSPAHDGGSLNQEEQSDNDQDTVSWLDEHSGNGYLRHRENRIIGREARVLFVALEVLDDPCIRVQLTEFRVDATSDVLSSYYQPGLPIKLFDRHSPFPERLETAFTATNMTKFHLYLSNDPESNADREIMREGRVASVLGSMPHLEELKLEPHGMPVFSAIPWKYCEPVFPHVRDLEISCGDIDPNILIEFLKRHDPTLERLSIWYCSINPDEHDDEWEDVIRKMTVLQERRDLMLKEAEVTLVYGLDPRDGCGHDLRLEIREDWFGNSEEDAFRSWEYDGIWVKVPAKPLG
ncbi:hypothetical protein NW762_013257 [Fusarium torreyae]|uniref:F-box domain-containing protein n=1 Tax=Fusarium torreyae TaxID=1237075 RepID=A0A9W8V7V1_9HYPO|nr:hypothetical protein NW762_013257 [Fusarium torreyae]